MTSPRDTVANARDNALEALEEAKNADSKPKQVQKETDAVRKFATNLAEALSNGLPGSSTGPHVAAISSTAKYHTKTEIQQMVKNALDELVVEGIKTNQPLHRSLVRDGGFKKVDFTIHYLEKLLRD